MPSCSINRVPFKGVNEILKAKCSKSFFTTVTYISFNKCWVVANDLLNPDLFFLDNVPLVEKGNLKLAESIISSIENCNSVTCNRHKQFLISYKIAVSFKLKKCDFPPSSLSAVCKPVSSVPVLLSFATACRSSSYANAFSDKSLSDTTDVCDGTTDVCNIFYNNNFTRSKCCFDNINIYILIRQLGHSVWLMFSYLIKRKPFPFLSLLIVL